MLPERTVEGVVYRNGFQGQEVDDEVKGEGNSVNYKYRMHDPRVGRFFAVDPLAYQFAGWSTYNYCFDNPIAYIDPDGRAPQTDFINVNTGVRTHVEDGKDQVLIGQTDYIDKMVDLFDSDKEKYNEGLNNGINTGLTNAQFNDLAGTIYSEASNVNDWKESAAIYSVMRNRANADKKTVLDVASGGGIYGWSHRGQIFNKNVSKTKLNSVYEGIATAMVSNYDFSGGAYFWHGTDFSGPVSWSRAHEDFYLVGFNFTSLAHDLWGLGDHKSGDKSYDFKYESTAAFGKTTFMKLTDGWKRAKGVTRWDGRSGN